MPVSITLLAAAAFACGSPVAVDGDTLHCAGRAEAVRLVGIDAPELPGHCRRGRVCTPGDGARSRAGLAALVRRGAVSCRDEGRDVYGRTLARCAVRGFDLSCSMIASGLAVPRYRRIYCRGGK